MILNIGNRRDRSGERGIFVIDLSLALVGFVSMMAVFFSLKANDSLDRKMEAQANYYTQVNNAVRAYVSRDQTAILGLAAARLENGLGFLKTPACGGTGIDAFLPCGFLMTDEFGATPQILIGNELQITGAGSTTIAGGRTTVPPVVVGGSLRMDLAEKMMDFAESAHTPSSAATSINMYVNATLDISAAASRGSVYMDTMLAPATADIYLRVNGGNTMLADLDMANNSIVNGGDITAANVTATNLVKGSDVQTNGGITLRKAAVIEDVVLLTNYPASFYSAAFVSTAALATCEPGLTYKIFANVVANGNVNLSNASIIYAVPVAGGFDIRVSNHTSDWVAGDIEVWAQYRIRCG